MTSFKVLHNMVKLKLRPLQHRIQDTVAKLKSRFHDSQLGNWLQEVLHEYQLHKAGLETLELCNFYGHPEEVITVPLLLLDHNLQGQQLDDTPAESIYLVLAQYRYCIHLAVGKLEQHTDLHGNTSIHGSAPLAIYTRPIEINEWTMQYRQFSEDTEHIIFQALSNLIQDPKLEDYIPPRYRRDTP